MFSQLLLVSIEILNYDTYMIESSCTDEETLKHGSPVQRFHSSDDPKGLIDVSCQPSMVPISTC